MDSKNYTQLNLENNKDSKGKGLMVFVIFVLVVAFALLLVFLVVRIQNQNKQIMQESSQNFTTPAPSLTAAPTPDVEEEVNAVNLGTDEADFNTVQQDIDQL